MKMHGRADLWTCEIVENNLSHRAFCNVQIPFRLNKNFQIWMSGFWLNKFLLRFNLLSHSGCRPSQRHLQATGKPASIINDFIQDRCLLCGLAWVHRNNYSRVKPENNIKLKFYMRNGLSIYKTKYCKTTFLASPCPCYTLFNLPVVGKTALLRQK